ncbi:MAG: outer membrane beta-barrel protein [Gammaproteobacteria bacterium]|nr:outer membrane beta-barrel protein [Gammaproteobacteria bacterium]
MNRIVKYSALVFSISMVTTSSSVAAVVHSHPVYYQTPGLPPAAPVSAPAAIFPPTGFHGNVGVGANVEFSSTEYFDMEPAETFNNAMTQTIQTGPKLRPELLAGARYYFNKTFWGLRLGYTPLQKTVFDEKYIGEVDGSGTFYKSAPSLKDKYSVRGGVEFGYRLTPRTFIVAHAGLTTDEYKLRYDSTVDGGDDGETGTHHASSSFHLNGYVIGAGIERYLTQHIIGSVSYQEVRHNTKNKDLLHAISFTSSINPIIEPRTTGVTPADHIVSFAIIAQL